MFFYEKFINLKFFMKNFSIIEVSIKLRWLLDNPLDIKAGRAPPIHEKLAENLSLLFSVGCRTGKNILFISRMSCNFWDVSMREKNK